MLLRKVANIADRRERLQDAFNAPSEKCRLRRPDKEGPESVTPAKGNDASCKPHLVVTGRRAAEIVERPVARRPCGEDRVVYAHASLPSSASVANRAVARNLLEVCDLSHSKSAASELAPNVSLDPTRQDLLSGS